MKNAIGIVLIAFATLISFSRSCKNTTKAIKSLKNTSPAYIKYADHTESNVSKTKDVLKTISHTKSSADVYKVFGEMKKDSIKKSSP